MRVKDNKFVASEIFGRTYFRSYSEFYLALAMSNILVGQGLTLNMDGIKVDADSIPQDMIWYYKRLLYDGAIDLKLFQREDGVLCEDSKTDVDTSYFETIPLLSDNGSTLDWDYDYAKENYGVYASNFLEFMKLGNTLVHVMAYHLVRVLQGKETKKLIFHFDSQKSKSTFTYVNIYSCIHSIPWINDYIGLDLDLGDFKVDLDYSIFCNNGKVSGHHKLFSISEKKDIMEKYGMVEGSILALWSRAGMCENNEFGRIKGVNIIMLREIGDTFLGITKIALNKTKEEIKADFYDIPEESRHLFIDMLDKKPYRVSSEIGICGVGVDNYFQDEDCYLTLLDNTEMVEKLVTMNGKEINYKMTEVNAIYWLMCQYDIEFDRELYKDMYMNGEEPLWDMFND